MSGEGGGAQETLRERSLQNAGLGPREQIGQLGARAGGGNGEGEGPPAESGEQGRREVGESAAAGLGHGGQAQWVSPNLESRGDDGSLWSVGLRSAGEAPAALVLAQGRAGGGRSWG